MKDFSILLLFDYYGDYLSEKQREIFDLYYNEDLSLSEIAENAGITRQGARDSVKRTEQQLSELEDRLHFCEKSVALKKLADEVRQDKEKLPDLLEYIDNF